MNEPMCPTCCCPRESPYWVADATQIVEGCIDGFHGLARAGAVGFHYAIWYHRKEARQFRADAAARLAAVTAE